MLCSDLEKTYGNRLVQAFKVPKDVKLFKIYSIKTQAVTRLANICVQKSCDPLAQGGHTVLDWISDPLKKSPDALSGVLNW